MRTTAFNEYTDYLIKPDIVFVYVIYELRIFDNLNFN